MTRKLMRFSGRYACTRCGCRVELTNAANLLCNLEGCADAGGRLVPMRDGQLYRRMAGLAREARRSDRGRGRVPAEKVKGADVAKRMILKDGDGEELGTVRLPEGAQVAFEDVEDGDDEEDDLDLTDEGEDGDDPDDDDDDD